MYDSPVVSPTYCSDRTKHVKVERGRVPSIGLREYLQMENSVRIAKKKAMKEK